MKKSGSPLVPGVIAPPAFSLHIQNVCVQRHDEQCVSWLKMKVR
jgi:hypothetical protein